MVKEKAELTPKPVPQSVIMGCVCENHKSPKYQQVVTIKCSCSLFVEIPKAKLEKETVASPGGKIGKKMDSAVAGSELN